MKHLIFLLIFMPWFAQAAGLDYLLNGVTTPVKVDTATPANSRPYPFAYYNLLGVRTELAADATLAAMSAKLPATLGQKTSANSLAVVMASDYVYPLPTGAATSANQVISNGYLSSIDTKTPALVSGRVPVDVQTSVLPTGAATETTLAAINTKTPALGQATMAASSPVVISSDQSAIPVMVTDGSATGTIAAINQNVQLSNTDGDGAAAIQVTGTYTGALTFQGTVNGTTWVAVSVINANTGALTTTIASATQGLFWAEISAFRHIRIIGLAAMTGTATVTIRASSASNIVAIAAPIPAGTNNIGTVGIAAGAAAIGSVTVTTAAAKTVKNAAVTVGTTAVRATTDGAAVTAGRVLLTMRLDPASSAACYYGSSSVTSAGSTRGMLLFPGESVERINDAGDYYLICDTAGQTVFIVEQE